MQHIKPAPEIIRVDLKRYKEGYLATSKSLRGLFVAHRSLATVYDAIPDAIKLLYRMEYQRNVIVKEASVVDTAVYPLENVDFIAEAA